MNLSETITLIYLDEREYTNNWEGYTDPIKYTAKPCYAADKGSLAGARAWGEKKSDQYDWRTKKSTKSPVYEKEVKNDGFRIKLVDLDCRGNGGRAYRATTEIDGVGPLLFDLREDIMMDIIRNVGIRKGGEIDAEFVFAKIGSQMKMIRVDSPMYEKIVAHTNAKSKGSIKKIEVGGIYLGAHEKEYVYLGRYWVVSEKKNVKKHIFRELHKNVLLKYLDMRKTFSFKAKLGDFELKGNEIQEVKDEYIKDNKNRDNYYGKYLAQDYYVEILSVSDTEGYIHPESIKAGYKV